MECCLLAIDANINARVRWALCLVCAMMDWGKDDGCCLSLNKIEYGILFELAHADESRAVRMC